MTWNPTSRHRVGRRIAFFLLISLFVRGHVLADTNVAQTDATGTISGGGGVSLTGAAEYSIPITVPPGVAGMTPSVSLNYSSDRSTGLAGTGWTVSAGAQVIHRCSATKAQDPVAKEVKYTTADRLCLNGQRLVKTDGSAAYGIVGSSYRTEIATFQKIETEGVVLGGAPDRFVVTQGDGTKLIFGHVVGGYDGRIELLGSSTVRVWALSRIIDTDSNYIDYVYNEQTTTKEYDLRRIEYTGQLSPAKSARYKIRFEYGDRPNDVRDQYSAGYFMKNSRRLKTIKTSVSDVEILNYTLGYAPFVSGSSGHSRLSSVTECESVGGLCKAPISIDWSIGTSGWSADDPLDAENEANTYQLGDWDGDGVTDLFFPSLGSSPTWKISLGGEGFAAGQIVPSVIPAPSATSPNTRAWVVDFNGDGRSDILNFTRINGVLSAHARLSNGPQTSPPFSGVTQIGMTGLPDVVSYRLADVDGDGLVDLIYTVTDGNLYVRYNTGSSFAPAGPNPAAARPSPTFMLQNYNENFDTFPQESGRLSAICCMLNLNGDGIPDLLVLSTAKFTRGFDGDAFTFYGSVWTFYRSTGTGYELDTSFNEIPPNVKLFDFIDINGDGLDDITYVDVLGQEWVRINDGDGFLSPTESHDMGALVVIGTQVIDYNNDGRQDRIVHFSGTSGPMVHLSNGVNLVRDATLAAPAIGASSIAADFNGDGSTDLLLGARLETDSAPIYFSGPANCADAGLPPGCRRIAMMMKFRS